MSALKKEITKPINVIIMGAAGRDFHNFNVYFRKNNTYRVTAFTAEQIPGIEGRTYPPILAGPLYPQGIPIYPEEDLTDLIQKHDVDQVVFALSDTSHLKVMQRASQVLAAGADFRLMGPKTTMLKSRTPLISVCAVRTGAGKSQTTRRITEILHEKNVKTVVIRHPMPYGDLTKQVCQRYASIEDLDRYDCTIEEREEYEPHINRGTIVYAGVDYAKILHSAEKEAEVIIWDGGNNDIPFYHSDLHIVLVDPLRANHEVTYHPGETNLRMADAVIINKIETASPEAVEIVRKNIRSRRPEATVIEAASPIFVDGFEKIRGKDVLVIEDGPTLTHGGMPYGAGAIAAKKFGARSLVDPRPYAKGSIKEVFSLYPHLGAILPAMGYDEYQIHELEQTINNTPCDLVIVGTPIDITRVAHIEKQTLRVRYELQEIGRPNLNDLILPFIEKIRK
ncbi:MAG: cyclic 2,3-diphosphoglycerate synthase [Candidatus Ranarchaeia archaeon]